MEAVAIGAAKSALNSVVKTTTTAITDEIGLLLGVEEELFFIKEELEMMQGFLQVAKAENVKGVVVSIWVKQVQELAFDVEDCLQEASVYLMKKSCLPVMFSAKKRDHIARKIRVLKNRIEDVSKRNMRYNLINKDNGGHTYHESASTRSIANVEALLVGLDKPKEILRDLILKEHGELSDKSWNGKVISVVGMGGLGKTTLVREVYGCQELRNQFKCFAYWVTVLHPFNMDEFIESLNKQIQSRAQEVGNKGETVEGNKTKPEVLTKKIIKENMEEKVKEYLKDKKYLIVLDDLSSLLEWDKIKNVLPPVNDSRIIVTTRYRRPLAESISHPSDNIYEIKGLPDKDAFDLFCKAVYKTPNYRLVSDEGQTTTEITEEDSKVQKHCISNTITKEADKEIKDDPPQESNYNKEYGSSGTEDSQVQKPCITTTIIEDEDREMKEDLAPESKCNMKNGPSSAEITQENSEVQKQYITNTITEEEDREMKDDPPHKCKCNMKYDPSSTEITKEDSKVQKQCITNNITEGEDREMKDDTPHESKCYMEYGSSSTEITKEDSKVQNQCTTNTITEEDDQEIKVDLPQKNKCNMKNGPSSTEITKENTITEDMKTQADLIIKSCGRLPLAIVTIGSYLATKPKTSVEWNTMYEHLSSEFANNPDLGVVNNVLTSSYDGMPHHLKPCLLYLSVFHNHKEIRQSRIIRRWMADGYVMAERKKTAEEVGKGYFNDLMGRSLIQPSQTRTIVNGDIRRCNIHDMMYELILTKAVDESIVSLLEDGKLISMTDKIRHLVIPGGRRTGGKVLERVKLSHMRSVSIFGEVGDYLRYSRMKLVRVLDLEGTLDLHNRDLRSVGKLRHLKYLGLRGTKITKLPDSLGKLSELETLDIRNTMVVQLPTGITKLQKLSYLRAGMAGFNIFPTKKITEHFLNVGQAFLDATKDSLPERSTANFILFLFALCCLLPLLCKSLVDFDRDEFYNDTHGVRAPRGIGELRSLNILGVIDIGGSKNLAKEMQNLTNLSKLAVTGFTKKNGKTLAEVIDGLKQLRSLALSAADDSGLRCCLESVSSPPKYLQSLKLYSPLGELPDWISSLENLEKIYFTHTELTGEIKAIGKLPNLKILYYSRNSFRDDVDELCFGEGTFPILQVMIIEDIFELESVLIKKTALKSLEQLKIINFGESNNREVGVSGLEFLEQLKEMEVVVALDTVWKKTFVSNLQEKLSMHPKKPFLRVFEL